MSESTWLTREAYDRLKKELDERKGPLRVEIANKIDEARQEGDLKENGGYHAAREEQGLNEARIVQLEALLRDCEVGEIPEDDGVVEPGMVVTANLAGREISFLLGARESGEGLDLDVYSPEAPLGKAINGKKIGDKVLFKAPNGKEFEVEILDAKPFVG
ncbi:transcription elongation factor GreA [Actinomyces sp. zg-332]|uniref:transcription elongation factor GreA n=1 Tax=Actinomyces sp. zg-332 TaxID=2708340 RepID=UPI001420E947|nr:transcription elongation factor GreA [Actinomyces sp. zg-332]QPK94308.1 transcription elongation factor GreA [Actinomyces sp. zg-332]